MSAHYRWPYAKILNKIPFSQTLLYFESLYRFIARTNPFGAASSGEPAKAAPAKEGTPLMAASMTGSRLHTVKRNQLPPHLLDAVKKFEAEGK